MQNQDIQPNEYFMISKNVNNYANSNADSYADNDYVDYAIYCMNSCMDCEDANYDENSFIDHQRSEENLHERTQQKPFKINPFKINSSKINSSKIKSSKINSSKVKSSKIKSIKPITFDDTRERYFKVYSENKKHWYGRYYGKNPQQAASKAFTHIMKAKSNKKKKYPEHMKIHIKEMTRGSKKKIYAYEATRIANNTPHQIFINSRYTGLQRRIVFNYRNKIKKAPVSDQLLSKFKKKSKK